jgi:hypothetical protein
MAFEIQGKLHKKYDIETKTASFQAREFVLLIEESNYPQYIKFQLTQERCNILDAYEEGQSVKVWFDLRGREWNEKYFTNLNAWKMEKLSETSATSEPDIPMAGDWPPEAESSPDENGNYEDDLPF